jgi:P27 family predicted phage terminase small subunit
MTPSAKKTPTKAPKHLSRESAAWWREIHSRYEMQSHHTRLLTLACEAWDRSTQAREALATHGTTYIDRFKAPRARPEVGIERDSRLAFARLVREIGLDAAEETPRPPGLRTNRR